MNLNHVLGQGDNELVTLDARRSHPNPLAFVRQAREARERLRAMDLTVAEQVAVAWALNGLTPPTPLSDELAQLVATARKGGRQ